MPRAYQINLKTMLLLRNSVIKLLDSKFMKNLLWIDGICRFCVSLNFEPKYFFEATLNIINLNILTFTEFISENSPSFTIQYEWNSVFYSLLLYICFWSSVWVSNYILHKVLSIHLLSSTNTINFVTLACLLHMSEQFLFIF